MNSRLTELKSFRRLLIGGLLLLGLVIGGFCHAVDLSRGFNFVDGQRVTAAQLNGLVDNGTIVTSFYTGKASKTNLSAADLILIYDPSAGLYRKITASSAFLNNVGWFDSLPTITSVANDDQFLVRDVSGNILTKTTLTNLYAYGNQPVATNYPFYSMLQYDGTNYTRLPWSLVQTYISTNWWQILDMTNAPLKSWIDGSDLVWILDSTTGTNKYVSVDTLRNGGVVSPALYGYNDLIIQTVDGETNKIHISADELMLKNGNDPFLLEDGIVNYTLDATASITNGIIGPQESNTWYYIYVVSNGENAFSIALTNITASAAVGEFVYSSTVLGAAYHTSSNTFVKFSQFGRAVAFTETNLMNRACTTANTFEYLATTNLTAFQIMVPPIAKSVSGSFGVGTAAVNASVALATRTNGIGAITLNSPTAAASGFYTAPWLTYQFTPFTLQLSTNVVSYPNIAFRVDDNTTKCRINISGYGL